MQRHRPLLVLLAINLAMTLWLGRAHARTCDGPIECCPSAIPSPPSTPVAVRLGVVLVGLHNVNEKGGTWDADFYLSESWHATPGFVPETEVVNEISRQSEQFDDAELHGDRCVRSRRIHSTLRSSYNLRTFPFDHQNLTLEFSDAEFVQRLLHYDERPSVADVDDEAKDQLSNWKIEGALGYKHAARVFREDGETPSYDYATFSLPVRRHIAYHLTKFFLPLFIIVAVAFTTLWIDPDDLNSKASVGVTCLLAAIAFQLAEAGTLPEVAYLTLADRVYAICYTVLALSLMFAVYSNSLARKDRKSRALKLERIGRAAFPACLLIALLVAVVRSATQVAQ